MKKRRSKKVSDQIRQLLDDSGESRYSISKATGIDESTLSKFYLGQRGLSSKALDALGEHLKLRIVSDLKPAKKGK